MAQSCWPLLLAVAVFTAANEALPLASEPATGTEAAQHWAFRPPVRPRVPKSGSGSHPIDAFINARQAQLGLTPAPEADRRTLIRRLSLDLLGLPPSVVESEAFQGDVSPDAYAR